MIGVCFQPPTKYYNEASEPVKGYWQTHTFVNYIVAGNQPTNKGYPPEYAAESEIPFATDCPECHTKVVTNTEHKAGPFTWVACIMLASFG